ncbi:MAG: hypothetical protein GY899_04770 [Verrucomicrobiaceae bacterium]|nr:hypothetical protein [Verrucomicrobiaceae bacterium]
MKSLVISLFSFLIFGMYGICQDAQKQTPIDVTNDAALTAVIGKNVIVTGKVRDSNLSPATATLRIYFAGSGFRLLIEPDDFDASDKWGIEEKVGKVVFVRGKLVKDDGFLQISLTKPNQIADSPEKLPKAPAGKPPGTEEKKEYEPASPGAIFPVSPGEEDMQPEGDALSVKVVLPMFTGGPPTMVVTEVTAEIIDKKDSGPMQATFELKPKLDNKPMIAAMTYLPKKYKSLGWPRDKTVHFIIDEVQADSAPPNFAAAVLIECLLAGIEIPENVVLFGGMNRTGKIMRSGDKARADASYVEAVELVAKAALPPQEKEEKPKIRSAFGAPKAAVKNSMYLITGQVPAGTLDDFILDEDWMTLNSVQVLSCTGLEEALELIRAIASGTGKGKPIVELSAAQKVLRERSIRMLSNPQVWARIVAAGRSSKGNNTAFAYARMRTKKVAKTYSLERCISYLDSRIALAKSTHLDKLNDRDSRKYMRDLVTQVRKVEAKVHPDAALMVEVSEDYLKEIEDHAAARRKVGRNGEIPQRIEEKHAAAKTAYEDARSAARKKL